MEERFNLTRRDRELTQEAISRAQRQSARQFPPREESADQYFTPEVYIARTPPGGIPALAEETGTANQDFPGSAECPIWRTLYDQATASPRMAYAGFTREVLNLSHEAIGGGRWVICWRDKFGAWFTAGIGPNPDVEDTGTGADLPETPQYLSVVTNVCMDTGDLVVERTLVKVLAVVPDPVCFVNPEDCCVEETTGTGTSPGISSPCCEDSPIPRTLYASIVSNGCLGGVCVLLTYRNDLFPVGWYGDTVAVCGDVVREVSVVMYCAPVSAPQYWYIAVYCTVPDSSPPRYERIEGGVSSSTCDPFNAVFEGFAPFNATGEDARCFVDGADVVTVSETVCTEPTGTGTSTPPSGIVRTPLGSANVTDTSLTQSVTVADDSLLVVCTVGAVDGAGSPKITGVTFNGVAMTSAGNQTLGAGPASGGIRVFYMHIVAGMTADVVVSADSSCLIVMHAVQVTGLVNFTVDKTASAAGASSVPDSGATATTTVADEYAQGYIFTINIPGYSWQASFTDGQFFTTTLGANGADSTEGYRILSATGTVRAQLDQSADQWVAIVATFS